MATTPSEKTSILASYFDISLVEAEGATTSGGI